MLSILVLTIFVSLARAVDINLLLLFSLTRIEDGHQVVDPVNTAAFLAVGALIEQFNNRRPSVVGINHICDVDITYTPIDTRSDFTYALSSLTEVNLEAFDAVIGPSRSTTCIPISFATLPFKLPVISHSCTSPELDDPISHPNFARTVPSDDSTANAFASLIRKLPEQTREPELKPNSIPSMQVYSQVIVLYQDDSYGSKYKDSLFENRGDIEFHFFPFKPNDPVSIQSAINSAAETRINIFIGIFNVESLKKIVEAAMEKNLMGQDRLWMFTDGVLGADEIIAEFTDENGKVDSDVLKVLQNSFLVQAGARIGLLDDEQSDFDDQFMDPNFGYVNDLFTKLDFASSGFDFTSTLQEFTNPGFQAADFALFAYDALLTIRNYVDASVDEDCNITFDKDNFLSTIVGDKFSFDGVTGTVEFDHETGARSSATIKLVNLRFGESERPERQFQGQEVLVGTFEGFDWSLRSNILFNEDSFKAPLLVDPPAEVTRIQIEDDIKAGMFGFAGFLLLIVGLLFGFIYKYRNRNVIKAAQPLFLNIMLTGIVISTLSVYILPRDSITTVEDKESGPSIECNAPFFLISLGITIAFAALVFKLQRVAYVANTTPELRDNKVYSMWDSIKLILFVVAINVSCMIAAYAHNPLVLTETITERDEYGQPLETFDVCEPDENGNGEIYGLILAFHLIFYIYGFRLIAKTRDMSTDFQEGRWIALSVLAQFQLYLLGIPVVIAVGADAPGIRYLVIALIVHFSNIILIILVFAPKIYRVITGDDDVVWSDRNDVNSGLNHYSTKKDIQESMKYQSVRKSLYNTMATQEFGNEITL